MVGGKKLVYTVPTVDVAHATWKHQLFVSCWFDLQKDIPPEKENIPKNVMSYMTSFPNAGQFYTTFTSEINTKNHVYPSNNKGNTCEFMPKYEWSGGSELDRTLEKSYKPSPGSHTAGAQHLGADITVYLTLTLIINMTVTPRDATNQDWDSINTSRYRYTREIDPKSKVR
ncbi:unnamed protein product [Caretta caretta]